jgi:hypothetical protein
MLNIKKKILCFALEGTAMVLFLQGVLWILVVLTVSITGRLSSDHAAIPHVYGYVAVMFLALSLLAYLGFRVIKGRLKEHRVAEWRNIL